MIQVPCNNGYFLDYICFHGTTARNMILVTTKLTSFRTPYKIKTYQHLHVTLVQTKTKSSFNDSSYYASSDIGPRSIIRRLQNPIYKSVNLTDAYIKLVY